MTKILAAQLTGYQQALSGLAYFQIDEPGYLRISGQDRLTFLQRQTSNDLNLLSQDNVLTSVLTSSTGRILDVLTIFHEEDQLAVLTLPGFGNQTGDFLQSRIFFMDKVSLEVASQEIILLELFGPRVGEITQHIGAVDTLEKDDRIQSIVIGGIQIQYISQSSLGQRLIIPHKSADEVLEAIKDFGASPLSLDAYESLRIEKGIPAVGHELMDEYTPLETGYQWAVSESKGCYTGQEVLARQISYDKITRQMVGLKLVGVQHPGDTLWSLEDGKKVGVITSSTLSPNYGPIALGIVKRPFNQPGTEVRVIDKTDGEIARITSLPF
jgi:folate-binding protein YgfZ